jgi:hypothetical protein
MQLLYILAVFIDLETDEYDEYEVADLIELNNLRKQLENENYKFSSSRPIYG